MGKVGFCKNVKRDVLPIRAFFHFEFLTGKLYIVSLENSIHDYNCHALKWHGNVERNEMVVKKNGKKIYGKADRQIL